MKNKFYLAGLLCSITIIHPFVAHAEIIDFNYSPPYITSFGSLSFSGSNDSNSWVNGQANPFPFDNYGHADIQPLAGGYAWSNGWSDLYISTSNRTFNLDTVGLTSTYNSLILIDGYLNGVQKYETVVSAFNSLSSYSILALSWANIDKVTFSTTQIDHNNGSNLLVSGLDVHINAVPGPIAGAGLPALLGLMGFAAWRRRQQAV